MFEKQSKAIVCASQLMTLRQFPRHQAILKKLGIHLPNDAIIVIGLDGIKILITGRSRSPEVAKA